MDAIAGFCGCPRHEQKRFRNVKDHYLHKKGTVPKDSPLWRIVLNSEQMGCNPAAVFELYPVEAVSSAVDSCRCRSRKELAERFGYSSRNVARYLRINELIQPIKDLVDTSRISLVAAVELSYLDAGEQWLVYRGILSRGLKLIHRAAEELRKHSGELTEEMMIDQFGLANTSRNSLVSSDTTVSGGMSVMI